MLCPEIWRFKGGKDLDCGHVIMTLSLIGYQRLGGSWSLDLRNVCSNLQDGGRMLVRNLPQCTVSQSGSIS
jgi:hypothetical protein